MPGVCSATRFHSCWNNTRIHNSVWGEIAVYIRKLLRVWVWLQIAVLLLTMCALCADIAAERTRFTMEGAPAAALRSSPLPFADALRETGRLPDMPPADTILRYAAALPAPTGCLVAAMRALWQALCGSAS